MRLPAYTKTIVAAVAAAASVLGVALTGDQTLDATELVQVALAVLGAFGVYALPNKGDGAHVR
jgi:hypothetical protein